VECRYQLSICSRVEENYGKSWPSWLIAGPIGCKPTSNHQSAITHTNANVSSYLAAAAFEKITHLSYSIYYMHALDEQRTILCICAKSIHAYIDILYMHINIYTHTQCGCILCEDAFPKTLHNSRQILKNIADSCQIFKGIRIILNYENKVRVY
jgi:hypothetical protein